MQNELERYKNFDPTNAPLVKPSFVKKLQERHAIAQAKTAQMQNGTSMLP